MVNFTPGTEDWEYIILLNMLQVFHWAWIVVCLSAFTMGCISLVMSVPHLLHTVSCYVPPHLPAPCFCVGLTSNKPRNEYLSTVGLCMCNILTVLRIVYLTCTSHAHFQPSIFSLRLQLCVCFTTQNNPYVKLGLDATSHYFLCLKKDSLAPLPLR